MTFTMKMMTNMIPGDNDIEDVEIEIDSEVDYNDNEDTLLFSG